MVFFFFNVHITKMIIAERLVDNSENVFVILSFNFSYISMINTFIYIYSYLYVHIIEYHLIGDYSYFIYCSIMTRRRVTC